jgi:hypothetical protein
VRDSQMRGLPPPPEQDVHEIGHAPDASRVQSLPPPPAPPPGPSPDGQLGHPVPPPSQLIPPSCTQQ